MPPTPPPKTPREKRGGEKRILAKYEARGLYTKLLLQKAADMYDTPVDPRDPALWLVTWDGERTKWFPGQPAGSSPTVIFSTIQNLLWRNVHCYWDHDRPALIRKEYIPTQPGRILDLNPEDATAKFDQVTREWVDRRCHVNVQLSLCGLSVPHVTKVVGFGLGGFFFEQLETDNKRSMMQHRLLMSIRDFFAGVQKTEVKALVQDPGYGDLEKHVLGSMGVQVSDHPIRGFLEVDSETVVVSIAPQIPVKQIITDISSPALIIWDAASGLFEDPDGPSNQSWREIGKSPYDQTGPSWCPRPLLLELDPDTLRAIRSDYTSSRVEGRLEYEYKSYPLSGDWSPAVSSHLQLEMFVRKEE